MIHDTENLKLSDLQLDTLEIIAAARWSGLTQGEICMQIDRTEQRVSVVLRKLMSLGLVVFERESGGEARGWKRWRLTRYQRRAAAVVQGTSLAAHRVGTLDDPFGVRMAPRVVDAAQCRPWAAAACSRSAA